jgi:putative membrane protein
MRMTSLVAAMGTLVLVACSKDGSKIDSTRVTDSAAGAPAAPVSTTPALTDANIFALLDEANMADSAGGKLASTKGTSADVKAFGVMMMNDHHALRVAGQDLATKLAVAPTPPANDSLPAKARAMADSATAMARGAAWDKWYMDHEVMMHQEVLRLIDAALSSAQSPELKDLLNKARPNIEAHLKRAQDIQAKLTASTT